MQEANIVEEYRIRNKLPGEVWLNELMKDHPTERALLSNSFHQFFQ
jgi:hypothetical protein